MHLYNIVIFIHDILLCIICELYLTCIEGSTEQDIFSLYTTAHQESITSGSSIISQKLCNLQICIIYQEKGLFTALLLVFVA